MGRMSEEPEDFEGPWSMCQATMREAGLAYPRTCQRCGLGPCQRGRPMTVGIDLASGPDKTVIGVAPNPLVPRLDLEWALRRVDPRTEPGMIVGALVNEVRVLRERVDQAAPQQAEPVAWVPVHESNGPLWSFAEDRKESLKDWPFPAAAVFLFPPDAEAVLNSYADENQQISDERDAAQAKVQRLRDAAGVVMKQWAAKDDLALAIAMNELRRALEGK